MPIAYNVDASHLSVAGFLNTGHTGVEDDDTVSLAWIRTSNEGITVYLWDQTTEAWRQDSTLFRAAVKNLQAV